jgi:hypothetical protein
MWIQLKNMKINLEAFELIVKYSTMIRISVNLHWEGSENWMVRKSDTKRVLAREKIVM